jgi:hypothetical protein
MSSVTTGGTSVTSVTTSVLIARRASVLIARGASVLAAMSVCGLIACGGAGQTDLFDSAGTSQFGTDPSNGSPDSGTSSNGNSGGTNGNGGGNSGGNGGGNSGGNGGGNTTDAGNGNTTDAGNGGVDSGGITTSGAGIYCGANASSQAIYCSTKNQECCGTKATNDPNFDLTCVALGGTCAGVPIHCDDQTDCLGGQVCCGQFDQTKGYLSVGCATTCGNSGSTTGVRLCDPGAQVDECLSIGMTCSESQSLTGFYRCSN